MSAVCYQAEVSAMADLLSREVMPCMCVCVLAGGVLEFDQVQQ